MTARITLGESSQRDPSSLFGSINHLTCYPGLSTAEHAPARLAK
jgi:hypothetical protein